LRALPALATLVALTGTAAAHAFLQTASPAAGENLHAPTKIALHFSEPLEPAFSGIAVTDEAGRDEAAGPVSVGGTEMDLPLKRLAPGRHPSHGGKIWLPGFAVRTRSCACSPPRHFCFRRRRPPRHR
jgi:hypothetical protein